MAENGGKQDGTPQLAPAKPPEQAAPTLRYVDRPDCGETFADSITQSYYDGQSLRIEFAVTRLDELKTGDAMTGRRTPTARLVLTPMAAADLINRLKHISHALTQTGVLKAVPTKQA